MTEPFLIREAGAGDYEQVCTLYAEVDALHAEHASWLFRSPPCEPRSREFFARQLQAPDTALLVAQAAEVIAVGTVIVRSAPEFGVFVPQQWGVLDNIAVAPAWRRRGVGTAITRAAEAWASARGAHWLELVVYDFNAEARAFYDALGYAPASTKLRKPLAE